MCSSGTTRRMSDPYKHRHGRSGSKLYTIWRQIIQRCENPNNQRYADYGGRGIRVCDRWHSFVDFASDVGDPPPGCSLDRIDNDGHYSPENVRWARPVQQASNRRNNVNLTLNGRTQTQSAWARELGISHATIWMRLKMGWTIERALTTPTRRKAVSHA